MYGYHYKLLIAKSGAESSFWLPLWVHHTDTAETMRNLIKEFVSGAIADVCGMERKELERVGVFLAAVHDIGKATVGFQYKISRNVPDRSSALERSGLRMPDSMDPKYLQRTPHALAGESILRYLDCPETIAAVVGAHHGVPADSGSIDDLHCDKHDIDGYWNFYGHETKNCEYLKNVWKSILSAALDAAGFETAEALPSITPEAQMVLSGLLICADWLASNTTYFPLISVDDTGEEIDCFTRAVNAWEQMAFPAMWSSDRETYPAEDFQRIFGFPPSGVQRRMLEAAAHTKHPGIMILEAPMGCGKTEAALSAAEIIAHQCSKNGVFFGMPTQATANGIFPRIQNWAEKQSEEFYHSIQLKHGSAVLNERFQLIQKGIPEEESDSGLVVHSWFCDSKKACLADFVVATVDQMLMMALKRKHVMLLHLGLSEKVIIVDEVHAYDAYMNQYLERALQWLGAYHTPVILLSATLPAKRRMALVRAYLRQKKSDTELEQNMAYPLLTWTDGTEICQEVLPYDGRHQTVTVRLCVKDDLMHLIETAVRNGGCVGVIVNTVNRAQAIAEQIRSSITSDVLLYHAQYIMPDRAAKEEKLLQRIGHDSTPDSRTGFVAVGTQVLEQSLDIDFDVLLTDICPIDLLLQRIGRLHRHRRQRPDVMQTPVCYVMTDELDDKNAGSRQIYGEWLLQETLRQIPEHITLPDDISPLVQTVYSAADDSDAYKAYLNKKETAESKAGAFLLRKPPKKDIHGLLDRTVLDSHAEASVRGGISSIEVLVMQRDSSGTIRFLDGTPLSAVLTDAECERIARQKLRLPSRFSQPWNLDKTVHELEEMCRPYIAAWQRSYMLNGQLVLFLDEKHEADLAGYHLHYDDDAGLVCEKRSDEFESNCI